MTSRIKVLGDSSALSDDSLDNHEEAKNQTFNSLKRGVEELEEQHLIDNERKRDNFKFEVIPVKNLEKRFNHRGVPFDFEFYRSVKWPHGISLSKAQVILKKIVDDIPDDRFPIDENIDELKFLSDIHTLAHSVAERQISPISVMTSPENPDKYILISGERRSIAHVYAGLAGIQAKVYPSSLSSEDVDRIQDAENEERVETTILEKIISKRKLFLHFKERVENGDSNYTKVNSQQFADFIGKGNTQGGKYLNIVHDIDVYNRVIEQVKEQCITTLNDAEKLAKETITALKGINKLRKKNIGPAQVISAKSMDFGANISKGVNLEPLKKLLLAFSQHNEIPEIIGEKIDNLQKDDLKLSEFKETWVTLCEFIISNEGE